VLYWSVNNLDKALDHFEELGAKLYRGPMAIENRLFMCQIEDPFGN
ncbi:VOC family protein, partial [Vibrio sp. 1F169]